MSEQSFEAAAPSEEVFVDAAVSAAPATRKQGMTVYTVMLLISFISLIIGTIILFIEAGKFGGWNTESARPTASVTPAEKANLDFFV